MQHEPEVSIEVLRQVSDGFLMNDALQAERKLKEDVCFTLQKFYGQAKIAAVGGGREAPIKVATYTVCAATMEALIARGFKLKSMCYSQVEEDWVAWFAW